MSINPDSYVREEIGTLDFSKTEETVPSRILETTLSEKERQIKALEYIVGEAPDETLIESVHKFLHGENSQNLDELREDYELVSSYVYNKLNSLTNKYLDEFQIKEWTPSELQELQVCMLARDCIVDRVMYLTKSHANSSIDIFKSEMNESKGSNLSLLYSKNYSDKLNNIEETIKSDPNKFLLHTIALSEAPGLSMENTKGISTPIFLAKMHYELLNLGIDQEKFKEDLKMSQEKYMDVEAYNEAEWNYTDSLSRLPKDDEQDPDEDMINESADLREIYSFMEKNFEEMQNIVTESLNQAYKERDPNILLLRRSLGLKDTDILTYELYTDALDLMYVPTDPSLKDEYERNIISGTLELLSQEEVISSDPRMLKAAIIHLQTIEIGLSESFLFSEDTRDVLYYGNKYSTVVNASNYLLGNVQQHRTRDISSNSDNSVTGIKRFPN